MQNNQRTSFVGDGGYAAVEATILFPIIIMIFAGLVLLSMYLPQRATLQRATQYAAVALATERSDAWLEYDENTNAYRWDNVKDAGENVYVSLIKSVLTGDEGGKSTSIVEKFANSYLLKTSGELSVDYEMVNYIVYKEVIITATKEIASPVDLSFVGFPKTIPITVSSTAVVVNGDEFVREMDIVVDLVKFFDEKYNISTSGLFQKLKEVGNKFSGFLGI